MKSRPVNEKGSISITVAIFSIGLMGLILLLMSYAQYAGSYTRTREAATNTARVAAQELGQQIEDADLVFSRRKAEQAALIYLSKYPNIKLERIDISAQSVFVEVSEVVVGFAGSEKVIKASGRASNIDLK